MSSLFLATCRAWPQLPENLRPLCQQLRQHGVKVIVSPWQDDKEADLVLPLCAWDYSENPELFTQWLESLAERGIPTVNSVALMQWNMRKHYLQDLAKWGVDVIPTEVLIHPKIEDLYALVKAKGWQNCVLKPAVGQSGKFVTRWNHLHELLPFHVQEQFFVENHKVSSYQGLIVQPYVPEIEALGESSMIFFQGKFSHAVKRQPAVGEWRANSAYGVEVSSVRVSEIAIATAHQVLRSLPEIPAYARVDGIDYGQRFLLNELELIEPALYWHTASGASERFAQVLLSLIYR